MKYVIIMLLAMVSLQANGIWEDSFTVESTQTTIDGTNHEVFTKTSKRKQKLNMPKFPSPTIIT